MKQIKGIAKNFDEAIIGKFCTSNDLFKKNKLLACTKKPFSEIGINAFRECTALKQVVLGVSVRIINDSAFRHNISLETVNVKSNLQEIGNCAFQSCEKLSTINLVLFLIFNWQK